MAKERIRNDTRRRIAHLAARLMAEDGIEDHGLAKRKAARQAGILDMRQLPTNEEIDVALRAYQQLYQHSEHRLRLKRLREKALKAMRDLEHFNPYLTGSVLNGSAGKYADIDLQLFTDSAKTVELYLIDRGIPYKAGQCQIYSENESRTMPVFTVNDGDVDIRITVLSTPDLRLPLKTSPSGKIIERAKATTVETLVSED
jgi:hypothetical protein